VIKKSLLPIFNWQGQQQKPKPARPSNQHQNQFGSSGAQASGSGQNKPKSNKQKKQEAYQKRQKDKGKAKANEVAAHSFEGFINEVEDDMDIDINHGIDYDLFEKEQDLDDLCNRFVDHLEDYDTGMDIVVAGYQPF